MIRIYCIHTYIKISRKRLFLKSLTSMIRGSFPRMYGVMTAIRERQYKDGTQKQSQGILGDSMRDWRARKCPLLVSPKEHCLPTPQLAFLSPKTQISTVTNLSFHAASGTCLSTSQQPSIGTVRCRHALPGLDFYVNAGNLNSGPCTCVARTLFIQPSTQMFQILVYEKPILFLDRASPNGFQMGYSI